MEKYVSYRYNENGLRTYKDTSDTTTIYEWDGRTLLRETITYKSTNQKKDIWYLYDANEKVIGFEYSYLNSAGTLVTARVYYEKNLQGDIIGLLDARGAEIAAYTYDAWGKITSKTYVEGNEIPYELNHILYRGYYRDDETGFYYLQSRYYDAEVGRFINADDVNVLGMQFNSILKDNLYCYCESNPVNKSDDNGYIATWLVGAAVGAVAGYLLYWAEWKLGIRYWNWWHMIAVCATNAALTAWNWGIAGGPFLKLFKLAGMLQKSGATGVEIRIIKLMNKSRKLIVNMVVKSMYKKKGESWGTVIRRWLKSV